MGDTWPHSPENGFAMNSPGLYPLVPSNDSARSTPEARYPSSMFAHPGRDSIPKPYHMTGPPHSAPIAGPSSMRDANDQPSPAAFSSKNIKRKKTADSKGTAGESPGSPDDDERKKRLKTARACDPCRRKKIRCEIIPETDPPLCQHCKQHTANCTFFLPITETRWKRKGKSEEIGTNGTSTQSKSVSMTPQQMMLAPIQQATSYRSTSTPNNIPRTSQPSPAPQRMVPSPLSAENRMLGPTSMSYLMHSMSSFPVDAMRDFDTRHSVHWSVNQGEDGVIQLQQPDVPPLQAGRFAAGVERLQPALVQQLVNEYFNVHAEVFPVITKSYFLHVSGCPPLMLETICGLTAASRNYPAEILRIIKRNVYLLSREEDFFAHSSLQSVQALLLFGFTFELERGGLIGSKIWNTLGAAIRMAYDIGLHREYATASNSGSTVNISEAKRRTWAGLVIADRWISAMFGLPMAIDLGDCDRLFPSTFDLQPGQREEDMDPTDQPYMAFNKLLELSILLGRVLKLAYTPTGILGLTDETAKQMEEDLYSWRASLPEHLRYDSESQAPAAGYLNLLHIPVFFLFCRPFMRISFTVEALTYHFGMENWIDMVNRSGAAIRWAAEHPFCIEIFCPGLYSLFICALVQYHMHVRTHEEQYLQDLKCAVDVLANAQNDECIARTKVREIITLLYETATSLKKWERYNGRRGMNPTKGVLMRPREPNVAWDEVTRTLVNIDSGETAEPATSYTAATGPSPSASTPTSDLRTTSRTDERSLNAPVGPSSMLPDTSSASGMPAVWRTGIANVNPAVNVLADVTNPHMIEPSLDFAAFGTSGPMPAYDAAFFPDSLLDLNSWSSFFEGYSQPTGFPGATASAPLP